MLAAGASISSLRPLGGGLAAAMHAFVLRSPAGIRGLVLRRYPPAADAPAQAERCWRTLAALERLRLPAPRPVWLDASGSRFGCPALVMTRIHGQPDLRGEEPDAWTGELAAALLRVHRAPTGELDLSFLPAPGDYAREHLQAGAHNEAVLDHPRGADVLQALRSRARTLAPVPAVLVHGDYWAGNTLSRRGRVVAVVDWDDAALDEPGRDVGYCRTDVAMLHGPDAAERFLRAYERRAGGPVPNLAFWDLMGALAALPNPERWLPGYHALGRRDVTAEAMRLRLEAFIVDALRRGGSA